MSVLAAGAPSGAHVGLSRASAASAALGLLLLSAATSCSGKSSQPASQVDAGGEVEVGGEGGAGAGAGRATKPNTPRAGAGGSTRTSTAGRAATGGAPAQTAPAGNATRYPLKLGPAGAHYLVDQKDRPFFWAGEAAWSLIAQLSLDDARAYLDDRQSKGVNVLMVNLIEHKFASHAPANHEGERPFGSTPFSDFNEDYFAHADDVLREAAARDMVVLLAPVYLGYDCGDEGFCQEVMRSSAAQMRTWGRYVGQRYASFPNLVWLIGGDADPTPVQSKLREVVNGIREQDTVHLMSAHDAPESTAISHWKNESWLTVNNIYTYDPALYTVALDARKDSRPFFLAESTYEHEHDATSQSLRAQAYWAVLSGAMGHIFGNCPLWHFDATTEFCDQSGWRAQLDSPGSESMQYLRSLFLSRAWQDLVPDTDHSTLTRGFGTFGESDYAAAALTVDRSTFIAYLPSARQITVDLATLSGSQISVTWFDPARGTSQAKSSLTGKKTVTLSPPSGATAAGDWVLILDDSARGFAAPGSN